MVASNLRRVWITLLVLATLGYYFWTLLVLSGGLPRTRGEERDHYNPLARGFRKGHLYLDQQVPAELMAAKNPYDPTMRQNIPLLLYDASYYQGKYYIYFGPTPVITVLMPFRLLTGRDLPLTYAVGFYACVGYLALAGIFLFLQRRHFPHASALAVSTALVGLGGANMLVALLRRPHMWELAVAGGFAFFSVSLYCLVRAVHTSRPVAWATLGGVLLGLAVGCRPTYLLCSVLFALPWLLRSRRDEVSKSYDWRTVLGAAIGCGVPVFLLLVYNYARFGEAFEFGQKYQLTGIIEGDARHFSLTYLWFNFRVYFLAPLRWLTQFPFVEGIKVPAFPEGFGGHEYTFGILSNLPFAFASVVSLVFLLRSRNGTGSRNLWLSIGAIAGAALINAVLLMLFFGSCIRYMVDFAPTIMLLAAFGILVGETWIVSRAGRRIWLFGGLALASFSSTMAAAGVVKFYESASGGYPYAYRALARTLNTSVLAIKQLRWRGFGPRQIALSLPTDRIPRQEVLLAIRQGELETAQILVEYLNDDSVRFGYRETGDTRPTAYSATVHAAPGARHQLQLQIGDPRSTAAGPGGRLRGLFDGVPIWDAPVVSFAAYSGRLIFGTDATSDTAPTRFRGTIHDVKPITLPWSPPLQFSGVRTRIAVTPAMTGKAHPLITTGRTKAADFLTFEVHEDRQISFGYDHWGHPLIMSPKIAAAPGEIRVVEFWVPALSPPGQEAPLVVKMDGVTVWERRVPAYRPEADNIFPGANIIGGSNCERLLINAVFEDVQLARPN